MGSITSVGLRPRILFMSSSRNALHSEGRVLQEAAPQWIRCAHCRRSFKWRHACQRSKVTWLVTAWVSTSPGPLKLWEPRLLTFRAAT